MLAKDRSFLPRVGIPPPPLTPPHFSLTCRSLGNGPASREYLRPEGFKCRLPGNVTRCLNPEVLAFQSFPEGAWDSYLRFFGLSYCSPLFLCPLVFVTDLSAATIFFHDVLGFSPPLFSRHFPHDDRMILNPGFFRAFPLFTSLSSPSTTPFIQVVLISFFHRRS